MLSKMKSFLTLFTTLLLAFFCDHRPSAADGSKPNIIVIFTDDQTYRGVGYNNPEVKTPNLDALAADGITIERGYVASPICAAMMTWRYSSRQLSSSNLSQMRASHSFCGLRLISRMSPCCRRHSGSI